VQNTNTQIRLDRVMNNNAEFFLQRFDPFLYRGKGDSKDPSIIKRWSKLNYTPTMKKRLGMAAQQILSIPYGLPIFNISDFRFSVGNASVAATNIKEVNMRTKWVYFDHTGSKDVDAFYRNFSIPKVESALYITQAKTSQPKKAGYRFKFELRYLILFAHYIEKLRPEVAMAIRRAYFDKESSPRCALAMEIVRIGMQKKIQKPQEVNLIASATAPLVGFKTKNLGYSFRPYQLVGIAFCRSTNFRAMIGDQMGIGKTVQAIGCIKLAMEDKSIKDPLPVLIVCPSSVTTQWKEALNEWIPSLKTTIMIGGSKKAKVRPQKNTAIITTYETMRRSKDFLMGCGFKMVIFDESHLLKHAKSGRTKVGTEIGTRTPYVIMLTGTPMEKGVGDLWSQFHILAPTRFPNPSVFLESLESYALFDGKRYPDTYPMETSIVGDMTGIFERYDISDINNGDQYLMMKPKVDGDRDLRKALSCYMIRRLKAQVLDLPAKTRQIIKIPLDASGKRLYESYEKDAAKKIKQNRIDNYIKAIVSKTKMFMSEGLTGKKALYRAKQECQWLLDKSNSGMDSMLMFMDLKRQIGMLKTAMVISKLIDFIKGTGGREPILVFAEQHRVIDEIASKMSRIKKPNGRPVTVRKFTGKQGRKEREQIKADFNKGKVDILILNKAGNVGLNLQRASYVLFAERYWNPTDEEQAEDRAHRSGKTEPVTVFYIMIPDTIEDKILETIDKKRNEIENTVGNQSYNTSVRQQKVAAKVLIQQLHKHFNAYIGKVRVPDKEIMVALKQAGIKLR